MIVKLPHRFNARPYQKKALEAFDKHKRIVLIWHRRAGKDKTAFQGMIKQSLKRVGTYWYVFPTYRQGKMAIWQAIDNDGMRILDHIPKSLIRKTNEQEMRIELINGSSIQIVGTDKTMDNLMGANPVGCIFSEFPIGNPRVWDLISPILTLNNGWAAFVFTPRGKNHGWKIREVARENPDVWYLSELGANDTTDSEGNPIVTPAMVDQERRNGMDEDMIQQEYFVSFEASVKGAYYADQIRIMREDNRICSVPHEENSKVYTAWDIGMNDTTCITIFQVVGKEIRVIDYIEEAGEEFAYFTRILKQKGYDYETHFLPHDAGNRSQHSGLTAEQRINELGIGRTYILPRTNSVVEDIDVVRRTFKYIWIDDEKCDRLIACLASYHKEWNEKNQTYSLTPKHDWSSNGADSFRYMCIGLVDRLKFNIKQKDKIETKRGFFNILKGVYEGGKN